MHIMIVDDMAPLRHALRRVLEAQGHTVVETGTARQAMTLVDALAPDAVIADLNLGRGPSGVDVLEQTRSDQPRARRVLMSATPPEDQTVADALRSGTAEAFLVKPFSVGALTAALVRGGGDGVA